nr:hypothetical protein [Candidatus Gracilibacteria bacterium]
MELQKLENRQGTNTNSGKISKTITDTKKSINSRLNVLGLSYDYLKKVETEEKGFRFRQDTLEAIFKKYPNMSFSKFKEFFFGNIYNKNILMNTPEVIEILDLENIEPGSDLIGFVIDRLSMSKDDFEKKIKGKFDVLTFPNLSSSDVAQGYFFDKLKAFLPDAQIIFGDMDEIKNYLGHNQFNSDSVGFIDLMGNGLFNTCLFKLLKTNPNPEKISELNEIFSTINKDIFIGGSTYNIPFSIPDNLQAISLPKMPLNNAAMFIKKGVLFNSMGYLNSAYYADKVKGSFVLGGHNIAEPMHAGNLTVISNELENRYNHNWLISYFGENTGLLLYINSRDKDQNKVDDFLSIDREEIQNRYNDFQKMYKDRIIPLIYGVFYRFLIKNFPEKFKA